MTTHSPHPLIGVIINPAAGRNRGKRAGVAVVRELMRHDVAHLVIIGASTEDSVAQVIAASSQVQGFLLVGGDGLVHTMLQIEKFRAKPFGIFPAGSGNDFARALGFSAKPAKNVRELLRSLAKPQRIDAGFALVGPQRAPRWFAGHMSVGFVSRVTQRANEIRLPLGAFGYIYALLRELLTGRIDTFTVTQSGKTTRREALAMVIMNVSMLGGGIRLAPSASVVDGKLDFVEISPATRRRLFSVLPKLAAAQHENLPEVLISPVTELSLDGTDLEAYADGDFIGSAPIQVQSKPEALLVWLPTPA